MSQNDQQLLATLKQVADLLHVFFLSQGATQPSERLFVDAGQSLPSNINDLLLRVVRSINNGQQFFRQGFIFGIMTDKARILCKAAKLSPASYWSVVSAATIDAKAAKLTDDDIRRGLSAIGVDPDELQPDLVYEINFA